MLARDQCNGHRDINFINAMNFEIFPIYKILITSSQVQSLVLAVPCKSRVLREACRSSSQLSESNTQSRVLKTHLKRLRSFHESLGSSCDILRFIVGMKMSSSTLMCNL